MEVTKWLKPLVSVSRYTVTARVCRPQLSQAEHEAPEWLAAMEALILVATHGGPTMFARIGIMRNRHHVREFDLERKPHHWGRRKLKRDQ
jgi:hypothetical protein